MPKQGQAASSAGGAMAAERAALVQRLHVVSARLDAVLDSVRGLEDEELLEALDDEPTARSLGELVAELQPLLHATATPDGPAGRATYAATRFIAGYVSYLMGQVEPALACLRLAVAWWDAPASWHYLMAQVAAAADPEQQGQGEGAEEAYRTAIARDPRYLPAHIELQGLLADRGDMVACRALAADAAAQLPPLHWTNPWQRPDHMMPGLRASAWHDPRTFTFCQLLEANAHIIKAELLGVIAAQRQQEQHEEGWEAVGTHQRAEFGTDRTLVSDGGSWREFVLLGEPDEEEESVMDGPGIVQANCRRCPRTAALLQSIPEIAGLAEAGLGEGLFSSLAPGSKLKPHCGGTNARLTCHLGLVLGSGECGIKCGGETRTWEEGKCLCFDDSFEHEVFHDQKAEGMEGACQPAAGHPCGGERVVLLLRFWHPSLSSEDRWGEALEHAEDAIGSQMAAALPPAALKDTIDDKGMPRAPNLATPEELLKTKPPEAATMAAAVVVGPVGPPAGPMPKPPAAPAPKPEPEPEPEPEPDQEELQLQCKPARDPAWPKKFKPSPEMLAAAADAGKRIEQRAQKLATAAEAATAGGHAAPAEPLPPADEELEEDSDAESDVSSGVD